MQCYEVHVCFTSIDYIFNKIFTHYFLCNVLDKKILKLILLFDSIETALSYKNTTLK